MAKLIFSSTFLLYILHILSDIYPYYVSANKCDRDLFRFPYVHVKRKRNGGNLASLSSTGFLDLRGRTRVMLCINGPAILYSDAVHVHAGAQGKNNGTANLTSKFKRNSPGQTRRGKRDADESDSEEVESQISKREGQPLNPEQIPTNKPDKEPPAEESVISIPDQAPPTVKNIENSSNNTASSNSTPNKSVGEEHFINWEFKVFNHECFPINKVPFKTLRELKREQKRRHPVINSTIEVVGQRVFGVYLLGVKDGYNKSELGWLKGSNLTYVHGGDGPARIITDSSFLIVGNNTKFCATLPNDTNIVISQSESDDWINKARVCRWSFKRKQNSTVRYADMFKKGYKESEYNFEVCPEIVEEGSIILQNSKTTPKPVTHANYTEFDPFSMFNPNNWTPHGYRKDTKEKTGGDERKVDKEIGRNKTIGPHREEDPCTLDPTNPPCEIDPEPMLIDLQNVDLSDLSSTDGFEIKAVDCIELPEFDPNNCWAGDNGKRLLELYLDLVPKAEPDSTGTTPPPAGPDAKLENLNDNQNLTWKYDLLYTVSDIFSRLCMPFRPEMPYSIARIFAWYVYKAHLYGDDLGRVDLQSFLDSLNNGPSTGTAASPPISDQFEYLTQNDNSWKILMNELQRCRITAKRTNPRGLIFNWSRTPSNLTKWKIESNQARRKRRTWKKRHVRDIQDKPKESYRINGTQFSTKFMRAGKSLAIVKSEGSEGFAREANQEHLRDIDPSDPRLHAYEFFDFPPEDISHCFNPNLTAFHNRQNCTQKQLLFYYEDKSETEYELNIAIDMWWRIWSTVLGYCNKAYGLRKSDTFPRLFNAKYEYFFQLVEKEWKFPEDNKDLKVILSEYLEEENDIWMDSCLEASYVDSYSPSYRPPRPLTVLDNGTEIVNYFEELPPYTFFFNYAYYKEPETTTESAEMNIEVDDVDR